MNDSFSGILAFLGSHKYRYTSHENEERVNLTLAGKHADYRVTMRITHEGDYFQIYVHYPFRVRDTAQRGTAAELVCRANYGILIGGFEFDMSDGEVRFHVTHHIHGLPLAPEVVERLLYTALSTMDRYFPAFMQHLHAGHTPEDAVYLAEIDVHSQIVEEKAPELPKEARKEHHKEDHSPAPKKPRSRKASRKKNPGEQRGGPQEDPQA